MGEHEAACFRITGFRSRDPLIVRYKSANLVDSFDARDTPCKGVGDLIGPIL